MKKIEYEMNIKLNFQKEEVRRIKADAETHQEELRKVGEKTKELEGQKEETQQLRSEVRFLKVIAEELTQ